MDVLKDKFHTLITKISVLTIWIATLFAFLALINEVFYWIDMLPSGLEDIVFAVIMLFVLIGCMATAMSLVLSFYKISQK